MPTPISFTLRGQERHAPDIRELALEMAGELAEEGRYIHPLPAGVDYTRNVYDTVMEQVGRLNTSTRDHHIDIDFFICKIRMPYEMPRELQNVFWTAFAATYLNRMAAAFRSLCRDKQPLAFAAAFTILSILPAGSSGPYLYTFLRSPASVGIPNIIAKAFVLGIRNIDIKDPQVHYLILSRCLLWGHCTDGDDGMASIDSTWRRRIREGITPSAPSDKPWTKELTLMLDAAQSLALAQYAIDNDHQLYTCGNAKHPSCTQGERGITYPCGGCKTMRYCNKRCQSKCCTLWMLLLCCRPDFLSQSQKQLGNPITMTCASRLLNDDVSAAPFLYRLS